MQFQQQVWIDNYLAKHGIQFYELRIFKHHPEDACQMDQEFIKKVSAVEETVRAATVDEDIIQFVTSRCQSIKNIYKNQ